MGNRQQRYLPRKFSQLFYKHAAVFPNKKAFLIYVDGIGGAGKTTIVDEFLRNLTNEGCANEKIKDSEFGLFSKDIKDFRDRGGPACRDPLVLAHLFAANRRYTIASGDLEGKLKEDRVVIIIRGIITTVAYQTEESVNPYVTFDVADKSYGAPDLFVIATCDPSLAYERRTKRQDTSVAFDKPKADRIQAIYREEQTKLVPSLLIDTSSTGYLPKHSEELARAVAPFVAVIDEKYRALKNKRRC